MASSLSLPSVRSVAIAARPALSKRRSWVGMYLMCDKGLITHKRVSAFLSAPCVVQARWVSAAGQALVSTDVPMEDPAQGQEGTCRPPAACPGARRSCWEHVLFLLKTRKLRIREGKTCVCERPEGGSPGTKALCPQVPLGRTGHSWLARPPQVPTFLQHSLPLAGVFLYFL